MVIELGGKTGTAQKVKDGRYLVNNYILSFIGFLPADDPQIVVYIAIDNPKGVNQFGGVIAGPPAKAILEDAIKALDIKKPTGGMEKEYQYTDLKYKDVPNVVGKSKDEATKALADFKVEFTGNGSKVIYQSPGDGTRIYEGETVRVFMG